ncbi:MAG: V-type ATPase subunit [Promethearchaeota archaeon]
MSVARYSFINAKIRSMKADILTSEQWDALIGARNMLAALRVLDATGYAELVQDLGETTSPLEIERVLQTDFNKVLFEIQSDIPTDSQLLMSWITRKYQKEVVKSILRLYTSKSDHETAVRLFVPIKPFTTNIVLSLLEVKDLQTLATQIPDQYFQNLVQGVFPQYEETGDLFIIEQTLDAKVIQSLHKEIQQIEGLDHEIAAKIIGTETDLINLMITLRTHFLGTPADEVEKLLLDAAYRLPLDLCQRALMARSFEERVQILQRSFYKDLITQSWEAYEQFQSLAIFEHNFHKQIWTESYNALIGYPFHFGVVIGYLNLKWYETLNLKALMNGKADEIEPHIIRRVLIL